jgi:hypothetical protein
LITAVAVVVAIVCFVYVHFFPVSGVELAVIFSGSVGLCEMSSHLLRRCPEWRRRVGELKGE